MMTPTVFSHAALQRIPVRALSFPPELPKIIPLTPLSSTRPRIHAVRPSYSAFQSLPIIFLCASFPFELPLHHKKRHGKSQAFFHSFFV